MTAGQTRSREDRILAHMPLVERLARRYAGRGEPVDDLIQAGTIGLVKAVDRFDPNRGSTFESFATPTILGEIRRHFRDTTWSVRVPRGVQEARQQVNRAIDRLSGREGRSPSVPEIAEATGLQLDEVLDALAAASAQRPDSLSRPVGDDSEGEREIRADDAGFGQAETRVALEAALPAVDARARRILELRFERDMTQAEIAREVGISQMHVSRLLRRALDTLRREGMLDGVAPGAAPGRGDD